jgi:uroporphyrinogen-III synthase
MRVLVTRPEPDNARTADALRAQGHEVLLAPLLRIEPIADANLGARPWAAVLLSSANGARAVAAHPRRSELVTLPALVVGRSSAEAACSAGFTNVISADGGASDLSRLAAERLAGARAPLLYLAGEDRSGNLSVALAEKGLQVHTVVAYRAAMVAQFPGDAHTALEHGRIDGVLHFSRRSVQAYIACGSGIAAQTLAPVHYCLSARAAEPLRHAGATRIEVAAQPDEAALLALVARNVMPKP